MALDIAYLSYSDQSGVTDRLVAALSDRGHAVTHLRATGPLDHRHPSSRALRMTPQVAWNLALSAARYGRRALHHAWNTCYAFDVHSRRAGELLAAMEPAAQVVLQAGVLFSPGAPPRLPYVLLCDYTAALARATDAGAAHAVDLGAGWRARERAVYLGAAAIAAFSERVKGSLVRDYGVDPGRVAVVGAGANVVPRAPERRDDGRTVLFIGKEWERKGGPLLAEAFALLRRRVPGARLLVAGPHGPIDLPEGAASLGRVPVAELPALCARATAFAMPTLREPYGLAFLDAMACGLPCVGPQAEAVPEIIDDGRTGLLVPPADAPALAAALERLLLDRALAACLGAAGRAKVLGGLTWEHVAGRVESLLSTAAVACPPALPAPHRSPLRRAARQPTLHGGSQREHPARHDG
ncbi:MAG TPA: glycosyltransferase family 4 protein [Anaeromyxobacteraceae bacterium]|nr:glycosyltransferase family 4 protein [Anaeromyxobacteraceae bacterium]